MRSPPTRKRPAPHRGRSGDGASRAFLGAGAQGGQPRRHGCGFQCRRDGGQDGGTQPQDEALRQHHGVDAHTLHGDAEIEVVDGPGHQPAPIPGPVPCPGRRRGALRPRRSRQPRAAPCEGARPRRTPRARSRPQQGLALHHRERHGVVDQEHPENQSQEAQRREVQVEGADHPRHGVGPRAGGLQARAQGKGFADPLLHPSTFEAVRKPQVDARERAAGTGHVLRAGQVHQEYVAEPDGGQPIPGGERAGHHQGVAAALQLEVEGCPRPSPPRPRRSRTDSTTAYGTVMKSETSRSAADPVT